MDLNKVLALTGLFHQGSLSHLLSGTCELCLESADLSGFLCTPCRTALAASEHACSQCAEPLAHPGRCARCQQQPPAFDYAYSSYLYQPPLSDWLLHAKDQGQLQWLKRLAWLMQHRPVTTLDAVDGLVPVPSSARRLLYRGFNPAQLLAASLARHWHLPLHSKAIMKHSSEDQRKLSATQRRRNQNHSFSAGQQLFRGEHLLIIDDVITTGATANAVARLLKQQGAGIVGVWSMCRTPAKSTQHTS
ncbi:MAG: hypothetical protein CMI02_00475 [Oceanospirillaceae bacterium]|nr:hypothetical protein [Oceanospirillaceae bacterium]MBT10493.1 hypothetical protein [Oceanospirillaceae bacterium]|tara:strand:+ start:66990 stop:67730 length:741 start_codon:yes stop_codon:yes gene_type:complete